MYNIELKILVLLTQGVEQQFSSNDFIFQTETGTALEHVEHQGEANVKR